MGVVVEVNFKRRICDDRVPERQDACCERGMIVFVVKIVLCWYVIGGDAKVCDSCCCAEAWKMTDVEGNGCAE